MNWLWLLAPFAYIWIAGRIYRRLGPYEDCTSPCGLECDVMMTFCDSCAHRFGALRKALTWPISFPVLWVWSHATDNTKRTTHVKVFTNESS